MNDDIQHQASQKQQDWFNYLDNKVEGQQQNVRPKSNNSGKKEQKLLKEQDLSQRQQDNAPLFSSHSNNQNNGIKQQEQNKAISINSSRSPQSECRSESSQGLRGANSFCDSLDSQRFGQAPPKMQSKEQARGQGEEQDKISEKSKENDSSNQGSEPLSQKEQKDVSNNEESKSEHLILPSEKKMKNQPDKVYQNSDQQLNDRSCISVPDSAVQSQDASFLDSQMEHVSQLDNKPDINDLSNQQLSAPIKLDEKDKLIKETPPNQENNIAISHPNERSNSNKLENNKLAKNSGRMRAAIDMEIRQDQPQPSFPQQPMHLREERKVPNKANSPQVTHKMQRQEQRDVQIHDANRPQLLLSQQSNSQDEECKIDQPKNPSPNYGGHKSVKQSKPHAKINKLNLQKIQSNERVAQPQSEFIMEQLRRLEQLRQQVQGHQIQVGVQANQQQIAAVGDQNVSDTFREAQCIPGTDPNDINLGERFVFLKKEATSKMRSNKRKVRYIFEGEEENKEPPRLIPNDAVIVKEQEQDQKSSVKKLGESGQTPELFNAAQGQEEDQPLAIEEEKQSVGHKIVIVEEVSFKPNCASEELIESKQIEGEPNQKNSQKKVFLSEEGVDNQAQNPKLSFNYVKSFDSEPGQNVENLLDDGLSNHDSQIAEADASLNESLGSSFSSGSAFGNYSFHQSQAAVVQSEDPIDNKRRRGRSRGVKNVQPEQCLVQNLNPDKSQSMMPSQSQMANAPMPAQNGLVLSKQSEPARQDQPRPLVMQVPQLDLAPVSQGVTQKINTKGPKPSQKQKMADYGRSRTQEEDKLQAQSFGADKILVNPNVNERRRGSMVESRTDANNELVVYSRKQVKVRTPRRGRSKSIVVPGTTGIPRSFPIGRLNNYNKIMKRHKGPLSFVSDLESIQEDEFSEELKPDESSHDHEKGQVIFDVEKNQELLNEQQPHIDQNQLSSLSLRIAKSDNIRRGSLGIYHEQTPDDQNKVEAAELKKIRQLQNQRNRSHSVIESMYSQDAPNLQPIQNFGHGRRSKLVQKMHELQYIKNSRSKSISMGFLSAHQIQLGAQMLINSGDMDQSKMQVIQQEINAADQQKYVLLSQDQLALLQASNSQKQPMFDSNQFSDYLKQFKQQSAAQAQQDINAKPFSNNSAASIKPLGLDKSKARAALNNLKNLGSQQKSGHELPVRERSASLSIASSALPSSSQQSQSKSGGSNFQSYTFSQAQQFKSQPAKDDEPKKRGGSSFGQYKFGKSSHGSGDGQQADASDLSRQSSKKSASKSLCSKSAERRGQVPNSGAEEQKSNVLGSELSEIMAKLTQNANPDEMSQVLDILKNIQNKNGTNNK